MNFKGWVGWGGGSAARFITHRILANDPQEWRAFRQGDIAAHPQRAHRRNGNAVPLAKLIRPGHSPPKDGCARQRRGNGRAERTINAPDGFFSSQRVARNWPFPDGSPSR